MTTAELRDNAARVVRGFLTVENPGDSGQCFVAGYIKACRDAGAISLAEDQAAEAAINGRAIPSALRCCIWWGEAV